MEFVDFSRGAFSVVKLAKHKKTKEAFAIKFVEKQRVKMNLLNREIEITKKLRHPNVNNPFESFDS